MSPVTDPAEDRPAASDSAGIPWAGRAFEHNPHHDDDGSADPALLAALREFHSGRGDRVAIVDAYRTARVLIPLIPHAGDHGIGPYGMPVDKTQELSIVSVSAPDGRTVLPVFTSTETMASWNPEARPIPAAGVRTAVAALSDGAELIVIDPDSDTEFMLRRPAVWAVAQQQPWAPSYQHPEVYRGLHQSIGTELAVIDLTIAAGDTGSSRYAPELVITLELVDGLERAELDAVLARLAKRWAADDRVAELVDSLTVKIRRAGPPESGNTADQVTG